MGVDRHIKNWRRREKGEDSKRIIGPSAVKWGGPRLHVQSKIRATSKPGPDLGKYWGGSKRKVMTPPQSKETSARETSIFPKRANSQGGWGGVTPSEGRPETGES